MPETHLYTTDPHPADSSVEPTQLRWGLDDVMWGDDDSTTVMLSGPDGEPYWLELEADRTAALREALAGPNGEQADLRVRIAEALAREDGLKWGPGVSSLPSDVIERYHRLTDAVLAVFPAPADRADAETARQAHHASGAAQ
ncbi:hypothetical protein [Streptomyces sp. Da 82-17]|uniref:hypothetical protein n=1 Tax=Streptomyces sp. Da 82-17 TaxID=3377116 RepID=UPI0038D4EB11